jgi:cardiolipin synthase
VVFYLKTFFTIPNLLSLFRLCLIPFITTTYSREYYGVATLLLIVSGLTDTLDGFIARHFNQISEFGKFIDPLADKLTTASVVFALLMHHPQLWVTMGVLLFKELGTLAGAYVLYQKGTRPPESKIFGKLSTFVLYFILFCIMIADVAELYYGYMILTPLVLWILVGVSCVCMFMAIFQYIPIFKGIINGSYNVDTEQFEGETNS